jgi:RimJ/RimL family protein N-acetyltransferase
MHHTTLETARLRLRPFAADLGDVDAMLDVLGDPVSMRHYPRPFDREATVSWVRRNLERYERDGFGLLAIEEQDGALVIGDCGPTIQDVEGESLVELGWHVRRDRQGQGFATESAVACRDRAFEELEVPFLISLIRPENVPSRRVAEKVGMRVWRETEHSGFAHLVYRVDRGERPRGA